MGIRGSQAGLARSSRILLSIFDIAPCLGVALTALIAMLGVEPAFGQQFPVPLNISSAPVTAPSEGGRGEDVLQRFETADPPPGLRVGSVIFHPRAQGGLYYDDNIFAQSSNRHGDWIEDVGVGTKAETDLSRHYFALGASLEGNHYDSDHSEDNWQGNLSGVGRLDVTRGIQFGGDFAVRRLTVPRDSPDAINGTEPTVFHVYHGAASFLTTPDLKLDARVSAGADKINFNDVPSSAGVIRTEDRDHDDRFVDATFGYRYLGPQEVYVHILADDDAYVQNVDFSGFQRNSTGYRVEGGATMDLGGLVFADLSAGYQRRNYADPRFGSTENPVGRAALMWNPSRITTVLADASYEFAQSFNTGSPGYDHQVYTLTVEHELHTDLMAIARAVEQERQFKALSRNDHIYGGDAGLEYRLDRGLFVEGEYRYRHQSSGDSLSDYSRNIVIARIRKVF